MLIGHYTEQPWQDPKFEYNNANAAGIYGFADLGISNSSYDGQIGADLYNRYLDEKLYAEQVGYDALMLNEHHSAPFCMQGVTNVGACILARQTKKVKIVILGNVLPIWDDPLWLAEQLAMIDMISGGRLVHGIIRGTGRESVSHNGPPVYNRERLEEAHEFIVKTWTTPGPFRWEGKHYHYRYVNPWAMPLQKPHPPIWVPGVASRETITWAAKHRYPYAMIGTAIEPCKQAEEVYTRVAAEDGWTPGPQNFAHLFRVHVEATEEKAHEVGRKFVRGVSNPFVPSNEGQVKAWVQSLPGITSREAVKLRADLQGGAAGYGGSRSTAAPTPQRSYEDMLNNYSLVAGTPKTVLPKIRHVLEQIRPGTIFMWDGDGTMTHDDQMRSMTLTGQEVIPALREIAKELDLPSSFEVDAATGKRIAPVN
jgi:alkanesulfonate monooxygenase SsuD/methylene tetrahydromethanopterin reductase-like flavin-dependent oxidoreductase (luciferase family)